MRDRNQSSDTNFDLNLAPFLDIIVSIVPLLLLVVAFSHTRMIETAIPQVVQQAVDQLNKEPKTEITLQVGKGNQYRFIVKANNGQRIVPVETDSAGARERLYLKATELKRQYPDVFAVSIEPDSTVDMTNVVGAIDELRKFRKGEKPIQFKSPKTGEMLETDLMFPQIAFGNVVGG